MIKNREWRRRIIQVLMSLLVYCISYSVCAQFQWEFAGNTYSTRADAEAALRAYPSPQYLRFTDPWYEETLWRDPATSRYWYTVFDYQAASDVQFAGFTVNKRCGFFDGTDCNATVQEAVDSSHPSPTAVLCDVKFEVLGEFEFRAQQWEEVLDSGIRFWASETAPIRIDYYYNNLNTGGCDHGSSVNESLHRVSLATCTHDLSPISGSYPDWSQPPEFPNVCSPGGHEPPMPNIAAITKRLTSVCTATEGNPCSPMTGNKSLTETDFNAGWLEFTRHYNSSLEMGHGPVANGWSHSFSTRLVSSGGYTLIKPDGNVEEFSIATSGDYRSVTTPGKILVVAGDLAQLTYPGGRREIFQLLPSAEHGPERFRLMEAYTPDLPDRPVTLGYMESTGLLDSVTGPFGRQLRFEYDEAGNLSSLLLPDGNRIRYSHDERGNLSEVVFQDGGARVYLYEDPRLPNHLTGIIDENGSRYATYEYDAYGRVTLSEHSGGADRVSLDYSGSGTTEVTGPLGNVRSYTFDSFKPAFDVSGVSDDNGVITHARNADGWPGETTDAAGKVTRSTYDEFHEIRRVEAYGTPGQRTIDYTWDNELNRMTLIQQPGITTRFEFDTRGRLKRRDIEDRINGSSRAWSFQHFPDTDPPSRAGRIRSVDGPRSDVADITSFSYYPADDAAGRYRAGDLQSVRNAAGHVTEFLEYDPNGRLAKIRDANGVTTSFEYHPRGWLAALSIDGVATFFSYDRAGNLVRTVSGDGSHVDFSYDAAHRLIEIADSGGNRIVYTLDAGGNRVEENTFDESEALRRHLSRTFNSLGQLEQLIDSNGHSISHAYDRNGSKASTRDQNANSTHYEYDTLERMVRSIDPLGGETLMAYDLRDEPVRVTDPLGNVTRYEYDGFGNPISIFSPDTGITQNEFDTAGNRTATTDARGVRVEYRYDELGRLTGISYPDSSKDVSFVYDNGLNGKGRLTGMVDEAGTASYEYDSRGNLLSENRWINGKQYLTKYEYDSVGRLVGLEYPSGKIISFSLGDTGRVTGIQNGTNPLVSQVQYEPLGPVSSFTYGNGLAYSAIFNMDQELVSLESGGMNLDLEYGPAGSVLRINGQSFTYDALYRLETSSGDNGLQAYEYDANDNRVWHQDVLESSSYTYEPGSNRLEAAGGWTFTHDDSGNRTSRIDRSGNGRLYRFGDNNRMTEATDRDASGENPAGRFLYDGKGRRIVKILPDSETHFIYDLSGQLIGEYAVGGREEFREYVYLEGLPVAILATSAVEVSLPGAELILDNGDQGTAAIGSWRSKTGRETFGTDFLFAAKSSNTSYRWTATPPGDRYRVYAWWVSRKNQSGNVDYTVRHGSGQLDTVTRSQKVGGGRWQLLGSYTREDGQDYVEVSSRENRFTADAIRWVAMSEPIVQVNETIHYIHFDHLGTPRRVTDGQQSVIWSWDSTPFGNTSPDEDPDGDSDPFVLNLRFPGQYHDSETGLHYNFFRTYDPGTGRYLESDPIGLGGGLNPYSYVGGNPLSGIDPLGLATVGAWIDPPRFNLTGVGVHDWEVVAPKWSWWGYADFIRLHGHAAGYVNIDVSCSDECKDWEIHDKLEVEAHGTVDVGPNLYAILIGLRFGPLAGVAGNIGIGGASLLAAEHRFLTLASEKAGPLISAALKYGPTGICMGLSPGL